MGCGFSRHKKAAAAAGAAASNTARAGSGWKAATSPQPGMTPRSTDSDSDEENDDGNMGAALRRKKASQRPDDQSAIDLEAAASLGRGNRIFDRLQQSDGTIQMQTEISSSQINFFKMLDEKIENGIEYESDDEAVSRRNLEQHKAERETQLSASTNNNHGPIVIEQLGDDGLSKTEEDQQQRQQEERKMTGSGDSLKTMFSNSVNAPHFFDTLAEVKNDQDNDLVDSSSSFLIADVFATNNPQVLQEAESKSDSTEQTPTSTKCATPSQAVTTTRASSVKSSLLQRSLVDFDETAGHSKNMEEKESLEDSGRVSDSTRQEGDEVGEESRHDLKQGSAVSHGTLITVVDNKHVA